MLKEVQGKGGIVARVIAKSCSEYDKESVICTFELEYPRFIHSELMTHRLFSRNAMSSRAVPIAKMIEQVRTNPAMPIHWGKNQAGMQASEECTNLVDLGAARVEFTSKEVWMQAAKTASNYAEALADAGYHKQIVNRLLEPFQMMKTVVTATEFDNFFWLRCHSDAQPEIKELAECMYEAYSESNAEVLKAGEWHTPYVGHNKVPESDLSMGYHLEDENGQVICLLSEAEALKVSSSCCAQVSYRVLDNSLDKALDIYSRLVDAVPVHASPFEHQASPIHPVSSELETGVTHRDSDFNLWSGNFKGWIQHRQMLNNHTCWNYKQD